MKRNFMFVWLHLTQPKPWRLVPNYESADPPPLRSNLRDIKDAQYAEKNDSGKISYHIISCVWVPQAPKRAQMAPHKINFLQVAKFSG